MKIIEKKSIVNSEFTETGKQLKTDIYGEFDKEIIGNFAITGLSNFKDVLDEKDIKEAEIISKEGYKTIVYDKTDNLIKNINDSIGLMARNDIAKKGILKVTDFIIENKVNYENSFYSSVDGIFTYDDELFWFENNKVKEVEKPTSVELKKAIEVLNKLFKHTSIQDKSKIATIFKWFLSAPFAYLIRDKKIAGEYIKILNLLGESDAGKSALCLMFIIMWVKLDEPYKGTDAHNLTNFADLFKKSGWPLFIDEADAILEDDKMLFIVKSIYDRNYSRSKKEQINNSWEQKKQPAYSICITTSNKYVESTEKSETKRVLNMSFNTEDVSKDDGKSFKKVFNIKDKDYINSDFGAFEAFGREFFHQVKEKYKKESFEDILNTFLESLGIDEVLLEFDNTAELNKNIDDLYREAIIDLIIEDFNSIYRLDISYPINPEENKEEEQLITKREGMFFKAIDEQRIKYLSMSKDYKHVRVTGGINKELKKKGHKFDNMNIRTILDLFKEYNTGINSEGKNIRYVNIPIELLGI